MFLKRVVQFCSSSESFEEREWILKRQIFAILIISFFFGFGVLVFSFFRLREGNMIVGISQLILGIYLLFGFFRLKYDKAYYQLYSVGFMVLFFTYTAIIFFYVPQNHLNILWVISAPILIFFFLNRSGGIIIFISVFLFILYLMLSGYPYTVAEYVTLLAAFFITTFVMYTYEIVKEAEKSRLLIYNMTLEREVKAKTIDLKHLNGDLESRVEEELDKRLAQEQMLLRQCRMASMGEMIDSIAHQWRQPLMNINAILLNIDRVSEGEHKDYLAHKVDELSDLTTHMSQTIEDFRGLFKQNKEKQVFNLYSVTHEVLKLMANTLKEIDIRVNIESNATMFNYKNEFIQVMIILLNNAKEALHQREVKHKSILITVESNTRIIHVSVEDNAGGILSEHCDKIFNPYYTTKEQTGGTGLGLYISKIIIEHNMGGEISVDNTDKGANFMLHIPSVHPQ
jgi:signal transduction histidine kinase